MYIYVYILLNTNSYTQRISPKGGDCEYLFITNSYMKSSKGLFTKSYKNDKSVDEENMTYTIHFILFIYGNEN